MATKTISLRLEAYERLRWARQHPGESFSSVVMRAQWAEESITGAGLLRLVRERGPSFSVEELDRIEDVRAVDQPPRDKWAVD